MHRRRFVSLCGVGVLASAGCTQLPPSTSGKNSSDRGDDRQGATRGEEYEDATVVTIDAEPRAQNGVALRGRMESFGPHHRIMAGFHVPDAGQADPDTLVPLWNPAAVDHETPKPVDGGPKTQYGPSFALHVVTGQPRERPNDPDQWLLERGKTYGYRAVAVLPRDHEDVRITGERKQFTMPGRSATP